MTGAMPGPLGPKKTTPPAEPKLEQWHKVPGKPWLEVNAKGQLRTAAGVPLPLPLPKEAVWPFPTGRKP